MPRSSPREGEMQVPASSMASEAVSEAGGGERKRKKTLGRRKIEIKPIKCVEAKHVCFSKRREGLYKKASELCALTGAKVAVIVYSPAGKPYSFGHPSVSAVVERYLDPAAGTFSSSADAFEAPPPQMLYEFDGQRDRLCEAIAAEARRRDALDAAARAAGVWTDDVVRSAELPDLVAMLAALERVKDDADHAMRQLCAAAAGACDACYYDLGDGTFAADDYGRAAATSSHNQQAAMDAQTMAALLMGGSSVVGHAAAHGAPMLLPPPDLPPPAPAPVPLAFNYGYDHNHITGYEGYAYDLGDGGGHGAAYETEGCYFGPMATCNFFG